MRSSLISATLYDLGIEVYLPVKRVIVFAVAFLLVCGSMDFALGQTLTGTIAGTATDSGGAAVPGVVVIASSPALLTGTKTIKADSMGYYKFLDLPVGTYSVKFDMPGFKSEVATGIVVNSGTEITRNAALMVGSVGESVNVDASAVTIDTEHVIAQAVLTSEILDEVPNGRSPWASAAMVPSIVGQVFDVGGSSGMQASIMIVHGSQVSDQKFMIDGVNVTWPGGGGGSTAQYYDQGMFSEINYQVGAVPADIPQSGVYMNMVTKDGGDQIHGNIFADGNSEGMQSNNVDPSIGTLLRKNIPNSVPYSIRSSPSINLGNPVTSTYDYNAQLGGPILRAKLWWFGSFRFWSTNNLVAASFNPDGTQAINDGLIANEMAKFSYQLNQKNKITFMYYRNQKNRYHRRGSQNIIPNQATWLQNQPGYTGILKWTYTPSSRWAIDTGIGMMHIKTPYRYQTSVTPQDISVSDSALSTLSFAASYNALNPSQRLSGDSSVTTVREALHGTHSIKFGVQANHDYYGYLYHINGDVTGVTSSGSPTNVIFYNTPIAQQTSYENVEAFHIQDAYTVFRRLTINAGLRYEHFVGHIPAQTSPVGTYTALFNLPRSFAAINDVPNWNAVDPRFGLSWDVLGRGATVVKASISKYAQGVGMSVPAAVNPLALSSNTCSWTNDINGDGMPEPNEFLVNGAPTGCTGFAGGSVTTIDPKIKRPSSWEESVGVQQQLPKGFMLGVAGWHRHTVNQIGRASTQLGLNNYTAVTLQNPVSGGKLINPVTNAPITFYVANSAPVQAYLLINSKILDTEYRGLDVDIHRNFANHFTALGGFTWSRYRGSTTGDINSSLDDLNNPNYNMNRIGELPLADTPFQLKLSGVYKLPKGFDLSTNYQYVVGYALADTLSVSSAYMPTGVKLTQGSQTILTSPYGSHRLTNTDIWNVRLTREFHFRDRYKLQPEFDVYNLTNSDSVQSQNTAMGSIFPTTVAAAANLCSVSTSINCTQNVWRNPASVLPPRLFKVGAQFQF
jgi:hypothetical protein